MSRSFQRAARHPCRYDVVSVFTVSVNPADALLSHPWKKPSLDLASCYDQVPESPRRELGAESQHLIYLLGLKLRYMNGGMEDRIELWANEMGMSATYIVFTWPIEIWFDANRCTACQIQSIKTYYQLPGLPRRFRTVTNNTHEKFLPEVRQWPTVSEHYIPLNKVRWRRLPASLIKRSISHNEYFIT